MFKSFVPPEFLARVDREKCRKCRRCIQNCGWGVYSWGGDRILSDDSKCVACQRCYLFCPEEAITIQKNPLAFREHSTWSDNHRKNIYLQAETGGVLLTGMGATTTYPILWDNILIDACQVTNPSIDPLREPMELRTYLGRKPDSLEFVEDESGVMKLKT